MSTEKVPEGLRLLIDMRECAEKEDRDGDRPRTEYPLINLAIVKDRPDLMHLAANCGHKPSDGTMQLAAISGKPECLKVAIELARRYGCDVDMHTCSMAAAGGSLECLQIAHENGCAMTPDVAYVAMRRGNVECLNYALANGCKWREYQPPVPPGQ